MDPELLASLPPDVVYRHTPLAEHENAWGPWSQAMDQLGEIPETIERRGRGRNEEDEYIGFPEGSDAAPIFDFLAKHRSTLELIDEGLRRGRLQFPLYGPNESAQFFSSYVGLRPLARLMQIDAQALFATSQPSAAVDRSLGLTRFGDMICNGEGNVTHHLVGTMLRGMGLGGIEWFAIRDDVTNEMLARAVEAVDEAARAPDGMEQSLRVDCCCWGLGSLERVSEDLALEPFIDLLLAQFYNSELLLPLEADAEARRITDDRLEKRRQQILFLLSDHPNLFDKRDTVRRLGKQIAHDIRSLRDTLTDDASSDDERCADMQEEKLLNEVWPMQLTPGWWVDMLGDSESARARLAEYSDCWPDGAAKCQPPTRETLIVAREKLRAIRNPLGIMLAQHLRSNFFDGGRRDRHRMQLEGVRGVLAMRIFWNSNHKFPCDWDELVQAGLLQRAPIDPFSGEPFKYSRRREVIWSVGPDGHDDGGDGVPPYQGGWGKDVVFKLSTSAQVAPG